MMIFWLSVLVQFSGAYPLTITTGLFKRNVQFEMDPKLIECALASIGSQFKGFNIDEDTGDCVGVLNNDVTQIINVKTSNTFKMFPPMPLYKHSATDGNFYLSEVPGGVVTGLSIDVTLQPVDPWIRIVISLCAETLETRPLQLALRNDLEVIKLNIRQNDTFGTEEIFSPPGGFIYGDNNVYKFTVIVTDTHFQIRSNDTQLYDFAHRIDKSIATHLYVNSDLGSFATLYKVVFHLPQT